MAARSGPHVLGNACDLTSVGYYDRVYCEAEAPSAESSFMMALIKIGGVLVMPLKGALLKVTREGELSWKTIQVVQVSIPHLVVSEKCSSMEVLKFSTVQPLSLNELCRSNIRATIRDCLNESHPGLQMYIKCKPNISFDQKSLNEARRGLVSLRSVVDVISNQNTSDLDSTSENEAIREDKDDDNGDDVDVEEKITSGQCDKSLLKKLHQIPKEKHQKLDVLLNKIKHCPKNQKIQKE
ncbi:protein-L-isoaspartate O-methyltransferase domain-containing protein 2-like [Metopolophium dirhodum]|uniref:protein-L-isoaspartate O-methyltransferase domain-containing protein 2-like n=1 Tax=Metopolophium dirhodum TaxID=44670 RepID=UPI0029905893|nr:protein-L-isoaspartate O-methyltransferase domain-containing protein 2-like [Metopolophium dirhodum]XP_060859841.1 protein-L-isoaspartate O-methyltransferase domain-containing protein 2-like [Metopolophium dirhodum]